MQSIRSLCPFVASLAVMSMLLSTQTSHAATFYVATYGDDTNPCTQSSPCGTIKGGIARMSGGDTLIVGGGEYDECLSDYGPSPIPAGRSWDSATTIKAASGETVWLKVSAGCPGGGLIEIDLPSSQYIIFDGLNIDANSINGFGIGTASNYIRFQNMEVKNVKGHGIKLDGYYNEMINLDVHHSGFPVCPSATGCHGFYVSGWYNLIDHTRVHDNSCLGVTFSSEGGTVLYNTVQYSEIYNNPCFGVVAFPDNYVYNNIIRDNGAGVKLLSFGKALNNIIYNNHEIGIWPEGSNQEIKNNIVTGHIYDILDQETGSVDFADNICTAVGVPYTIGCTIAASP
jgi:hypothetical protein